MHISPNCSDLFQSNIEIKQFPDGESYVRLKSDYSNDNIVLHRLYPEQSKSIFELLQILDTLSEVHNHIKVIIPYLAYARQERRVLPGEAISAKALIKALACFNVRELITFDCHFMKEKTNETMFGVQITNIHLYKDLISKAKKVLNDNKALVIAPDKGAVYMGCDTYFVKERGEYVLDEKNKTYREISRLSYDNVVHEINQRKATTAILIDDIIASGGTILKTAKICRELGIRKLAVCCIHGQFLNNSDQKILEIADVVISSNTIINPYHQVNIAEIINNMVNK
ncbi:MAG: ribose-phosphate diphosphokinase [Candidatus Micrarchaeota archaeon]|nr:ribose-phosphate diphosphokinase [Candidatus Micrarchaeota archaeon]